MPAPLAFTEVVLAHVRYAECALRLLVVPVQY